MFTGIVEKRGLLAARQARGPGARLTIDTDMGPLSVGESIAVQGVCLSVEKITPKGFECDATHETLRRSTLGTLPVGAALHLERSLRFGDRLGGHLITGHVDGKVRLFERESIGEAMRMAFAIEDGRLGRFVAPKGSVAIDGVSLTVNGAEPSTFEVVIIPHTLAVTTLGAMTLQQQANLEVDLVARYVVRWLDLNSETEAVTVRDDNLLEKLKKAGLA